MIGASNARAIQRMTTSKPKTTSGFRRANLARLKPLGEADAGVKEIVEDVNDEIHSDIDSGNDHTPAHNGRKIIRRGGAEGKS